MSAEVPPATLPGTPKVISDLSATCQHLLRVLNEMLALSCLIVSRLVSSQLGFLWLQSFPIGEEKLISMAKQVFETSSGQKDASVLSEDFRFEFPIVSLSKEVCHHGPTLLCCDIFPPRITVCYLGLLTKSLLIDGLYLVTTQVICLSLRRMSSLQEYLKATGTFNLDEAFPNMEPHPYHWRVDPYEPNRSATQCINFAIGIASLEVLYAFLVLFNPRCCSIPCACAFPQCYAFLSCCLSL